MTSLVKSVTHVLCFEKEGHLPGSLHIWISALNMSL